MDAPVCRHSDRDVEYKIHLDQLVCRCGMWREAVDRGAGTAWRPREERDQSMAFRLSQPEHDRP
jgi:hypothetical protein